MIVGRLLFVAFIVCLFDVVSLDVLDLGVLIVCWAWGLCCVFCVWVVMLFVLILIV